jgi:type IV pilus assembly protein PilQ
VTKPVATSPLAPAQPAASVPGNPATAITAVRTDVSNGTFRAFIATDGRVSFKHFLLPNPDRIVIDITGVKSSVERNAMEVNIGGISRIRVGQFRTADPKVVRIVFDVTKMGPYDVRQVGSDLVLSLGAGASAPIPASAKPTPAPQRALPEAAPSSAPPVQKPLAPAAKPAVAKPIVSDDEPADSPASVKPATKPAVKPPATAKDSVRAPVATPVRPVSEELPPQNASGRPVAKPVGAPPRSAQSAPPGPVVPRSTGNDYMQEGYVGRPVNLELKNVDLRDVLRFLHNRFGVNFIVDKSVPASVPVDVSLKDVPWNQALEAILKSQGLGLVREDGKMIRVSTLDSIAKEGDAQRRVQESFINSLPLVTKIFKLKYASPVAKNTQAGGGGGQSQAESATFDPSTIRTGIYAFIKNRLSTRGRIEFDGRTSGATPRSDRRDHSGA